VCPQLAAMLNTSDTLIKVFVVVAVVVVVFQFVDFLILEFPLAYFGE